MHIKHLFVTCLVLLLIPFGARAEWMTDYWAALKKAQAEDKAILINFTGSDWCGWCIKLKNEVFSQGEFKNFADQNFVLLEVDFPRKKTLPSALRDANKRLGERFDIKGLPTIVILNKEGVKLGQLGYVPGGPRKFIAELKKTRGFVARDIPAPATPQTAATTNAAPTSKKVEAPAYTIPPPVIRYDAIALKGISGGRVPMALINNKSFAAGEKAKVKVGDKTVEILVKEIREDSVLVQIEGEAEPRELRLKERDSIKTE